MGRDRTGGGDRQASVNLGQEKGYSGSRYNAIDIMGARGGSMIHGYPTRIIVSLGLLLVGLGMLKDQAGAADPPTTPMLRLETGMYTAVIKRIGVDAAQRYLAPAQMTRPCGCGSWLAGACYAPCGPPSGQAMRARLTPWPCRPTAAPSPRRVHGRLGCGLFLYLFDRASGRLRQGLTGLSGTIHHLAYSRDGAFLVATLGRTGGMRDKPPGREILFDPGMDAWSNTGTDCVTAPGMILHARPERPTRRSVAL